jgi:hypothetical protein
MILASLRFGMMFVVALGLTGVSAWGQDDRYAITGIQAQLFFHGTGEIGTVDLLDGEEHALWNTKIGEGDAGRPSSATLVLVALSGPTFANAPGQLVVKATANKKTLLNQTLTLSTYFNEGNRLVLAFLVYDTGCGSLAITATLRSLPAAKLKTATLQKLVPFRCGE